MVNIQEYGWLSGVVYKRDPTNQLDFQSLGMGWEPLKYISDNGGQNSKDGGFSAGVYTNGNEIVIAFTGTNLPSGGLNEHIWTNAPAGFGWVPVEQVVAALELTLEVINEHPGANISFTGHSLGGGLATIMGIFFNKDATVFDLAPFKNLVINPYCVDIYYQYAKQLLEEGVISGIPLAFTKYYDDLEEVKQEVYRYAEDSVQRGILKKLMKYNTLAGNDRIIGSGTLIGGNDGLDVIGGGEGSHIYGGKGDDTIVIGYDSWGSGHTFYFNLGDGKDTIYSGAYSRDKVATDTYKFGEGITADDITFLNNGSGYLTMLIGDQGDQIMFGLYSLYFQGTSTV